MNKAFASFFQKKPNVRYLPVIITVVIGLATSVATYTALRNWESREMRLALEASGEERISALKRGIESVFIVLESLTSFYAASHEVERGEFHEFVKPLLKRHPSIQALEWIPRVNASQRTAYETAAHSDGFPGFKITERKAQGQMVPAAGRTDYFPVYFVEPHRGNELALGFDVASDPIRMATLEQAQDSGEVTATARITLVQETGEQFGILIFAPVYQKGVVLDSIATHRQALKGFILGVLRVGNLVEQALGYLDMEGVDIHLSDLSAPADQRFLYFYRSSSDKKAAVSPDVLKTGQKGEHKYTQTIDLAGRKWLITCTPASDFIRSLKTSRTWGVPLFVLLCTALLASYFSADIRSRDRLAKAYHDLQIEIREREQAEAALNESEEKYRQLVKHAPRGIFEIDLVNHRFVTVNDAACEVLGYSREEFLSLEPLSLFTKESWERVLNRIGQFLSDCADSKADEYRIKTKDNDERWVMMDTKVFFENGKPVRLLVISRDITERKKTEEALRKSETKFAKAFKNGPMVVAISTVEEGRYLEVNDAFERLTGYPREEVIGKTSTELGLWVDLKDRAELFKLLEKQGRISDFLTRLRCKSGEIRTALMSAEALEWGNRTTIMSTLIDITHRKRAEDALRESEKRYRNLFDSISDIIYTHDLDGRILSINRAAAEFLGYKPDDLVGMLISDIMLPEYREAFKVEYLVQIRKQGFFNGITRYIAKDGRAHYIEYRNILVHEEGKEPHVSGVGRDITERIETRKEVRKLEKQFQHAQKMEAIGTLAGGIAHDFNNLLMGVQGNASLMLIDTDATHPHHEKLRNIEQYVQSGAELTRQLLGFARGGKYEVRPTDLNELVTVSSEMFGRTKKEITIYSKCQEGIWAVEVDRGQIDQVLLNLYVNAWQSMPEGGEIYIETRNVELGENYIKAFNVDGRRYVRISVTDTGIGMDKATQERIFDPFFTTREMKRGTGMGLASAYGIVKNHGGIIDVESKEGEGTTFHIYLPASEKPVTEDKDRREEVMKGKETILVVDDEEMILDVARQMLESLAYSVLTACSGKETIEVYRSKKAEIDMVILDMIMPDMGGGEAFDRLREIDPEVKVLLSSGYSIDGQAQAILSRGCNGFIQKPFNLKELSQKIREILD